MELHSNSTSNRLSCFFCLRSNSRKYLNPGQDETYFCGNVEEEAVSSFYEFSLRNLYRYLNLLHSDKEEKDFNDLKMPVCDDCFRLNGEFNKLYNLLEETKLRLNWSLKKLEDVMIKAVRNQVKLKKVEEEDDDEKILEIWRTHTLDRMQAFTRTSFPLVLLHKNARKRRFPWIQEAEETVTVKMRVEGHDEVIASSRAETTDQCPFGFEQEREKTYSCGDVQVLPENVPNIQMDCNVKPAELNFLHDDDDGTITENRIKPTSQEKGFTSHQEMETEPLSKVVTRGRGQPAFISQFTPVSNDKGKVCCKSCKTILNRSKAFYHLKHDCSDDLWKPSISTKKNKHPRKCAYCSYKTSSPAGSPSSANSMVAHLARFHPEHYLISEKDKAEGLWHEQFRTILENMVYPDFILKEGRHRSCSLCEKIFKYDQPSQNMTFLKRHLLFNHKLELKEKLKAVLEDPMLEEGLNFCASKHPTLTPETSISYKFKYSSNCPYCSYKTTSPAGSSSAWGSMVIHLVRFHPEHYIIDDKDKASGFWHEQFQSILSNMIYPSFIVKEGHHRSCSLCEKIFKLKHSSQNAIMLKKHLIFHHKRELKEKFKAVLEDPSLEDKLKTCNLSNRDPRAPSSVKTRTAKCPSHCPYCSYKPASPAGSSSAWGSMVQHLANFHPEHYLIDENDRESGLWHEQFRSILTNMIYPNFILNEGHHRSCTCCGKLFKFKLASQNVKFLRKHLIFHHRPELKEKFKVVLRDPSLEEKLKTCILSNRHPRAPSSVKDRTTKCPSQCPYCNYKTVSPAGTSSAWGSMVGHLVRLHPEHYLIDEKDKAAGLWHEQFRSILNNMIYPSFIDKNGQHRSCSLCEKIFKFKLASQNAIMLKKHLLFKHKLELKEKFKAILKDPHFEEKLGAFKEGDRLLRGGRKKDEASYPTDCPYCSYRTVAVAGTPSAVGSMVSHFITFHPEHYLIDENDKAAGLWHEQFATILSKMVYPNLISNVGRQRSCSLCGKTYKGCTTSLNVNMMKRHLIFRHKLELKGRFKAVLEDPKLEERLRANEVCTRKKYSSNCPSQHGRSAMKETRKSNIEYSSKCSYCRFQCTTSNPQTSMDRHLVRFHPEHFLFEEEKASPSELCHPQFQRILSEMIFPKFFEMTGHYTKCSLCEMKYTASLKHENILCARKHLMLGHKIELRRSIKDVLEDPTLEEILASSNANGVTCSCGVYLEGRSPTFHENFHCIQIKGPNAKTFRERVRRSTRRTLGEIENSYIDMDVGESE